jgi:YD repeat-containing protein
VEIPLALESGCSSSPDWDCCDEEGSSCVGGPINISSGNMHYEETDISIDDPANFIFTRAYNNQETNLNITGAIMGYGWTHNFNQRLVLTNSLSDGRRIYRWLKGDGRKNYFLETSPYSNYFASYWPYGGKETMEDNGTTLTITDLNRNTINFDKTTGLWLSSCDFYGNCSTGAYSGGKLSQVTDPYGRTITFTYNGSNRLIEVTLWDGTTKWRYAYDSTNNYLT